MYQLFGKCISEQIIVTVYSFSTNKAQVAGVNKVLFKYLQKFGMGNEELERFDLEGAGTGTA